MHSLLIVNSHSYPHCQCSCFIIHYTSQDKSSLVLDKFGLVQYIVTSAPFVIMRIPYGGEIRNNNMFLFHWNADNINNQHVMNIN